MSTKTKSNKAQTETKTEVVEAPIETPVVTEETTENKWHSKYDACKECNETTHKHYSGGSCTRCYTIRRNQKLGLGLFNPETQTRKLEKLDDRIAKAEASLASLKASRKELQKIAS